MQLDVTYIYVLNLKHVIYKSKNAHIFMFIYLNMNLFQYDYKCYRVTTYLLKHLCLPHSLTHSLTFVCTVCLKISKFFRRSSSCSPFKRPNDLL